ncbi:MAG: hypothetical protein AAF671_04465, partial [Pseudomonadota bacterium]
LRFDDYMPTRNLVEETVAKERRVYRDPLQSGCGGFDVRVARLLDRHQYFTRGSLAGTIALIYLYV